MNTRLLIAVLTLFALLPLTEQAFGKCALVKCTITGTLQDELTTQPISNASIFLFFDDYKSTLSEGYATKYPDFFITDTNGTFVATAFFRTDSSPTSAVIGVF